MLLAPVNLHWLPVSIILAPVRLPWGPVGLPLGQVRLPLVQAKLPLAPARLPLAPLRLLLAPAISPLAPVNLPQASARLLLGLVNLHLGLDLLLAPVNLLQLALGPAKRQRPAPCLPPCLGRRLLSRHCLAPPQHLLQARQVFSGLSKCHDERQCKRLAEAAVMFMTVPTLLAVGLLHAAPICSRMEQLLCCQSRIWRSPGKQHCKEHAFVCFCN